MFFKFILIIAIGTSLILLGAASVQVTILSLALKALLVLMLVSAILSIAIYVWRRAKRH